MLIYSSVEFNEDETCFADYGFPYKVINETTYNKQQTIQDLM